jgi:hypothetical protein
MALQNKHKVERDASNVLHIMKNYFFIIFVYFIFYIRYKITLCTVCVTV